ncbi:hypothetical protein [Dysgonomonas sp. 511]|uniref:hypothetical protein n=1 Tax=Dysgonomonas sp. 511 TaxID=2302930 RepID=UPI0013D771F3|nr:hypothetical protein [Dysgonomonas sp. 511]NDV80193.1 hypothetical protein [Dysgonomonas sp. 511]
MELKDSMTVCFIPFRFNCENVVSEMQKSLWEPIEISVDKSFLYPHISKFLFSNFGIKDERALIPDNCLVYSLKDNWRGLVSDEEDVIRNLFNNYTLEIKKTKKIGDEDIELKYYFKLLNKRSTLTSPKLVFHQLSSVGFIMFCFEPDKKSRKFENYIDLNYLLHKVGKQSLAIRIEEDNEKNSSIYSSLKNYNRDNIKPSKKEKDPDIFYLHNLISFLLKNIGNNKIEFIGKENMHLLSYIQVDTKEKDTLPNEDIMKNFVRLARCQNTEYMVNPESDLLGNKIYMQTFDNIYIASCVEGGCVMTDLNLNPSPFIQDFKNNSFASRYIWTYMLVYLQRTMLLNLSDRLTNIDLYAVSDSKGAITDSLLKLSKMKANTYFSDISDITQHNLFYRFCSQNLSIRQHFDEVRDKIEDLDIVIKEQELAIKEQELEIRNKELKQQEEIEKNEAKRSRDLSDRLVYIYIAQVFFAIVVFSGVNVEVECLSIFYNDYKYYIDILLSLLAVFTIVFSGYLIYKAKKK